MRDDVDPLLGHETDEEFRFHIEAHARQLERDGLSPDDARVEARRRFGDLERARRESIRLDRRERRHWRFDMRQLIFAVRMLRRTPFVTAVAVLSLGLGIGANAAIFSLFNEVLMRPLPVTSPDGLVNIGSPGAKRGWTSSNNSGDSDWVFSYPMYRDLSADPGLFAGIAAQRGFRATVEWRGATRLTDGVEVSGNYFDVLGLRPALGRLIGSADTAAAGGEPVVVLSHDYWRASFERASDVIGQALIVNGQPLTIVGVAPEGFAGTTRGTLATVFVPITMRALLEPPFDGLDDRNN